MARISAKGFQPQLAFRFKLLILKLPNTIFDAKAVTLPQANNKVQTIPYGNVDVKLKGTTTWEPMRITLYNFEVSTLAALTAWWNIHHVAPLGNDSFKNIYKSPVTIMLQDPTGAPSSIIQLFNAFLEGFELGQMDTDTNEVSTVDITLAYDYAMWA